MSDDAATPTSVLFLIVLAVAACGRKPDDAAPSAGSRDPVARALAVAEQYVDGYYQQFPEEAYEVGYQEIPYDRWSDRSAEAIAAWERREDAWLAELEAIDPGALADTDAAVPYAFARDRLEAAVGRRVCRTDLWNVSPTWTGWQSIFPASLDQQPSGSPETRADALARVRDTSRYLATEIDNLREGLDLGYTAPKTNVRAVLDQVDGLLSTAVEDSPFFAIARRDPGIEAALRRTMQDDVVPAVERYRKFLAEEYLPRAREETAVAANPNGRACYLASLRYHASLPLDPEEVHRSGLEQLARIEAEMEEIGARVFGVTAPRELMQRMREEPRYFFRSEAEILEFNRAAVERIRAAVPHWFGFVPKAEVVVRPAPAFRKLKGLAGGFYTAGAEDGSRPGIYQIGTYEADQTSKAGMESVAFHETYPGHHLQVSVALERGSVHPVLKFFFSSGVGEGWGLYSERLADEMGAYTSDFDRLGMLSNQALRAARLVVDPGMHVLGWSRQQAIDYLLAHTAESVESATSEIDRYIAVPGQATAYMTGMLEIQRLRRLAEERLGGRFQIKAFHDRVLEDGTVTLGMLRGKIERWIAEQG